MNTEIKDALEHAKGAANQSNVPQSTAQTVYHIGRAICIQLQLIQEEIAASNNPPR